MGRLPDGGGLCRIAQAVIGEQRADPVFKRCSVIRAPGYSAQPIASIISKPTTGISGLRAMLSLGKRRVARMAREMAPRCGKLRSDD